MLEWLHEEDNYEAPTKTNKFIDKTIKHLSLCISYFSDFKKTNVLKVGALTKLIVLIIILLVMAYTQKKLILILVCCFDIFLISKFKLKSIKKILFLSSLLPLITLVMVSFPIYQGYTRVLFIPIKMFLGLVLLNIMNFSTEFKDILYALSKLKTPTIFIFIIELSIKYIILLGRISLEMFFSLKKRNIGKPMKIIDLRGIIGNLFLKSYKASEDTYDAMICRGYVEKDILEKRND